MLNIQTEERKTQEALKTSSTLYRAGSVFTKPQALLDVMHLITQTSCTAHFLKGFCVPQFKIAITSADLNFCSFGFTIYQNYFLTVTARVIKEGLFCENL